MLPRVLMIEDKPSDAEQTLSALSRIGVEDVLWARDSAAGLRLMQEGGMVPSLLLLHHHIGNAERLLTEMNNTPELKEIPIVTIGGAGFEPEQVQLAIQKRG